MLRTVHAKAVRLLSEGLRDLGVFPHMSAEAIEQHTYRSCFPHSVGEFLCLVQVGCLLVRLSDSPPEPAVLPKAPQLAAE